MRTLVLGSAAGLSLVGALAFATPSFAQDAANPPQVSTPAARQETRQLNDQAVDGTTASPAQLNGEPQTGPTPNDQSQAQYDQQKAQYDQQQSQYQADRARYHDEHARYNADTRRYDTREYAWDYPHHVYAYRYGDSGDLQRLYLIAQPQVQLHQVAIEGPNGAWVGRVRNVDTGVDGRPFRIEVSLNRRVSVWVPSGDFRFDAPDQILYTDLTRDQLWDMPGATVESSNAYYAP
ncbi:MAG TPA: hypothetical protein VHU87_02070 [Rhizomicrobium sp.]|jgi:hypothetical protein|nr:hypothetical protein [Rhizomicrobium sp.]